jgi:hypothetical protein
MKSTNEGPKMARLRKSTPIKRASNIEPRGRRRAPLPPWLTFLLRILPWILLSLTFDAVIHVHSDATTTAHVREK